MNIQDKYAELYNQSYQFLTPDYLSPENLPRIENYLNQNNQSLVNFSQSYFAKSGGETSLSGKSILETGCGLGGMAQHFSKFTGDISGMDISDLAIAGAKEISKLKGSSIEFGVQNLTKPNIKLDRKFDIIFDSHLLHCLTSPVERKNYLNFIKNHLNPEGVFMAETMTFNNEIQEPLGYELDANYILTKDVTGIKTPIRSIYPSIKIEDEIKEHLYLNYFYVHNELSFDLFPEIENYPTFRLPKTIRLCATLK
jgi:2-polyprenyl-3-methyl-5-hydroxy-6-metoxy-1,4-benzoquinol methylase